MEGRIGKYEIQAELGRGGFGKVYRAYDPSMARAVAIKVVTSEGDSDLLSRFRGEAEVHGKLHHKNIVTIYDYGEQNGSPYIVMELLEGENLQTLIQTKRNLTLLEKMRIMYQVAEGLHYAHQAGVVHRDVKPANIMLLQGGIVKIMDFGIARLVDEVSSRKTRGGDLIGTTLYMAPEQFQGGDADVQSDIFAYGVIYYELLSGIHPFQAAEVSAILYRIMSVEPLALREVAPESPEALEQLVHHALAKDRNRRYTSMDDAFLDADPIMGGLRREEAARLLAHVTTLMADGDFDRAHTTLKHALELDPSNAEARRLRESLQEEKNRRLLDQAVDEIKREGASRMAGRQFSDALQTLEAGLRMKPADTQLIALVADAKARMLGNREASRLLSEAKRETQSERLEEAIALAQKALECDPDNPEAPVLVLHLQDSIARIERAKRLNAALEAAENLLSENNYEQAIADLAVLETEYPGTQQIGGLQNRIRSRQLEHQRRERLGQLETGLEQIREFHAAGELAGSLDLIASIYEEFRGSSALENLKSSIEEEISANQRLAEISALIRDARALLWKKQLSECVTLLETGRKKFPADSGIELLLDAAKALDYEAERQQSVLAILQSAREMRAQERLDDAAELLKSGIRMHGQDVALADLNRVIGLQIEDRRARECLGGYCSRAEALLGSGSPSEALAVLREARSLYPSEPALELLLGNAEERYARQSEHDIVLSVLNACSERESAGDWTRAMEELGRGLRRLPASRDLLQAAASLRDRVQLAERERQLEKLVQEIDEAISLGEWTRARSTIASGKREFPDQVILDDLSAKVQAKQHKAETQKALAGVRESLRKMNLEAAALGLAELQPVYGFDELWKAEKRNLEHRQTYLANLKKAEALRKSGRYEEAEPLLQRLVNNNPPDAQAGGLLKTIAQDRASTRSAAGGSKIVWSIDNDRGESKPSVAPSVKPDDARSAKPKPVLDTPRNRIRGMCVKCHVIFPEGARFCDRCGKPVA